VLFVLLRYASELLLELLVMTKACHSPVFADERLLLTDLIRQRRQLF